MLRYRDNIRLAEILKTNFRFEMLPVFLHRYSNSYRVPTVSDCFFIAILMVSKNYFRNQVFSLVGFFRSFINSHRQSKPEGTGTDDVAFSTGGQRCGHICPKTAGQGTCDSPGTDPQSGRVRSYQVNSWREKINQFYYSSSTVTGTFSGFLFFFTSGF